MSGTCVRISELPAATLPLTGTEELPLRVGPSNARVPIEEILWAARSMPTSQRPDSSSAGGNPRGANAVDLQTSRTAATQVASGANAVIAGGSGNTASGTAAVVVGGQNNSATGVRGIVVGGQQNAASGNDSWCPGGFWGTARGLYGRGFWAANRFATAGDAQAGEFLLRQITSDATPARLTADQAAPSSSNTLNLPNNGTYRLKLLVVAQQTGGSAGSAGDCASWECDVLIKRGANAAATAFVGGRVITSAPAIAAVTAGTPFGPGMRDAAAAGWTLTLAADTTNGGLAVTGTGETNKTIRWVARVMGVEVTA
jgi:hypothetical protein